MFGMFKKAKDKKRDKPADGSVTVHVGRNGVAYVDPAELIRSPKVQALYAQFQKIADENQKKLRQRQQRKAT